LKIKHIIAGMVVTIFAFTAAFAFAAAGDPWFVIKDKAGTCKVIQAKDKTPATIAGPFKDRLEAKQAKGKVCKGLFRSKPKTPKTDVKPKPVKEKPKADPKPEVKPEAKPETK
jgi:hypothetical protein